MFRFSSFRSLIGFALAFVLLPFILFSGFSEAWIESTLAIDLGPVKLAGLLLVLLSVDAVMPIPSSYVAAAAMSRFGGMTGLAIVFAGLFCSSILAYCFGKLAKIHNARERVGDGGKFGALFHPDQAILASVFFSRGVPVAAEASSIVAGAYRIPIAPFVGVSGISCLIVALVYRAFFDVGHGYVDEGSVMIVGTIVPAFFWLTAFLVKLALKKHGGLKS